MRVVPFTNESFIEATQPVLYASGFVPQLDTVQVDGALGGCYVNADAELRKYRNLLDVAESASLGTEESRQLIHHNAPEPGGVPT